MIARSARSFAFLSPYLASPSFLGDPARAKALGHFIKFVGEQRRMEPTDASGASASEIVAWGMDITDREYLGVH